jgi:hypothetical protein
MMIAVAETPFRQVLGGSPLILADCYGNVNYAEQDWSSQLSLAPWNAMICSILYRFLGITQRPLSEIILSPPGLKSPVRSL